MIPKHTLQTATNSRKWTDLPMILRRETTITNLSACDNPASNNDNNQRLPNQSLKHVCFLKSKISRSCHRGAEHRHADATWHSAEMHVHTSTTDDNRAYSTGSTTRYNMHFRESSTNDPGYSGLPKCRLCSHSCVMCCRKWWESRAECHDDARVWRGSCRVEQAEHKTNALFFTSCRMR